MATSDYKTAYVALDSDDEAEVNLPPSTHAIEDEAPANVVTSDGFSKDRWNHIENLDDFFVRVYAYHQRNGFWCMLLEDVLQLTQFLFIVLFTGILVDCVNYEVLFDRRNATAHSDHAKYTIRDVFYPSCTYGFGRPAGAVCLSVALAFLLVRAVRVIYNFFKYFEIRMFFLTALRIPNSELQNTTWHELQQLLMKAQEDHHMSIHKHELTELDICNRILRFRNYFIAMVNKSVLPLKYEVPFLGTCTYLSLGLKFNLEYILFFSPWSPFENGYRLKAEYKMQHKRRELAQNLANKIFWAGMLNLVLSPLVMLWQILYCFFVYGEVLKREPSALGARSWSLYSREYLRHYNELSHELNGRLSAAYKVSSAYMSGFVSPTLAIMAKNVAFFAGAILAVLISLSVYDKDVLEVENLLLLMTGLGVLLTVSRAFVPDEHAVFCPEQLMSHIVSHIHYMPERWKGNAHTSVVREELGQLFPFKIVFLLVELFSPLLTPIILITRVRHRSQDIVDFFANFTVDVAGVGDVCSFAQMDVRKHGHPKWTPPGMTHADRQHQGEGGKTELSLMHFALANPTWQPPERSAAYLSCIREQATRDAGDLWSGQATADNPLAASVRIVASANSQGGVAGGSSSSTQSLISSGSGSATGRAAAAAVVRGAVSRLPGPRTASCYGVLTALRESGGGPRTAAAVGGGLPESVMQQSVVGVGGGLDLSLVPDYYSSEMCTSAMYMHELHHSNAFGRMGYDDLEAVRQVYRQPDLPSLSDQRHGSGGSIGAMRLDSPHAGTSLA